MKTPLARPPLLTLLREVLGWTLDQTALQTSQPRTPDCGIVCGGAIVCGGGPAVPG